MELAMCHKPGSDDTEPKEGFTSVSFSGVKRNLASVHLKWTVLGKSELIRVRCFLQSVFPA